MSNVSQMKGWVIHNEGGSSKWSISLWKTSPGHSTTGNLLSITPGAYSSGWGSLGRANENLTPSLDLLLRSLKALFSAYSQIA